MKDFFKTMEKLEAEERAEAPSGAPTKTVKAKTLKPEAGPEADLEETEAEPEADLEETETEAETDQEDDQEEEEVE